MATAFPWEVKTCSNCGKAYSGGFGTSQCCNCAKPLEKQFVCQDGEHFCNYRCAKLWKDLTAKSLKGKR